VTTQIAEYSATEQALALLADKYGKKAYEVTTTKGMQEAKEARAELRGYRVSLEKKRQELKAPALERSRLIDAEAKRITAALEALEDPIDEQIKTEEGRKEAERAERARVMQEKVAHENSMLQEIANTPLTLIGQKSEVIAQASQELAERDLAAEFDYSAQPRAREIRAQALGRIEQMLTDARAREEEQAKLEAERAELKRQKAAQEALQREQDEAAAAQRAEADRLAKLERDRQAAEEKATADAHRAEQDRIAQAERERLDAEAAALRAEQEAFRLQQEELEQAQKEQREREAQEAQAARLAQLMLDAPPLRQAAVNAWNLLRAVGYADDDTTIKLGFAIDRDAQQDKAAA